MSRQKRGGRKGGSARATGTAMKLEPAIWALGLLFALGAAFMSLLLSMEHLLGFGLPGCGAGSPCAEAAASYWGKVPGIDWSVSFLGLAYFLGVAVAWAGSRDGVSGSLLWMVRVGVLVSLFFVAIIVIEGHYCSYCLGAHAANVLFWLTLEFARPRAAGRVAPLATVGVVFVVASVGLGVAESVARERAEEQQAREAGESIAAMQAKAREAAERAAGGGGDPDVSEHLVDEPASGHGEVASGDGEPAAGGASAGVEGEAEGFRGRYVWGREKAPIRITFFTDYQCKDCYRFEQLLKPIMESRDDLSVSVKHFPFATDCNPGAPNLHPNACWAARAAEAAGILQGSEGFWKMHFWLFEHKGYFEKGMFEKSLRELGFEVDAFLRVMQGEETLARVKSDIEEALELGLHFTPLIYVNGVELRGWMFGNSLERALDAIAAENPPALTAVHDHPPLAAEKYVEDWREQRVLRLPDDDMTFRVGPADAAVRIVMFADYLAKPTVDLDADLRARVASRDDASYTIRYFPFDQACNQYVKTTRTEGGCEAVRAAEAAGRLGGNAGYWRMHEWLVANYASFSLAALRSAAPALGFDADELVGTMRSEVVTRAIQLDMQTGRRSGLRGVPMLIVNERWVPRWKREDVDILGRILDEAAKEGNPGG